VVRVGDLTLERVLSFSFRASMRELADQIQVSVADKVRLSDLRVGLPVGVAIDGRIVLVGQVMTSKLNKGANNRSISFTAFSSAQRMVKSSVIDGDGIQEKVLRNLSLLEIVEAVASPFEIVVDVSETSREVASEPISKVKLKKGEKAFAFLSRVAKRQGCIIVSGAASVTPERTAKASIRITRAAVRESPIPIVSPGPRVLDFGWELDDRAMHSEYIVTRRGNGVRANDGSIEGRDGRAVDERLSYSPILIQTSTGGNDEAALQRQAEWEMRKRAAEGERVTLTIDGWSPNYSQALWWPNTLYRVVETEEGLDELLLLTSATLTLDAQGTRAALELLPPDAYAVLDDTTIKKGSRRGYRANKEWLQQNSAVTTKIADASDNVDFDEAGLDLIFRPPNDDD
jgi:prophage tail gpP-like protein